MKHAIILLLAITFISCGGNENNSDNTEPVKIAAHGVGKQLFYGRCANCHMINKELTGPALKGAETRWPDKEKLYAFIRNSEAVIKEDKYARGLWLKYNQTAMNPHPDLTDDQIKQIFGYINSVSETIDPSSIPAE